MSGPIQIKKYNFDDIFEQHPDQIDRRLTKGYLSRREVTELLDHIKTDSTVSLESDKTSDFKWKIGDQALDTNQKTNNIPFWMRRISHWFNLRFDKEYKEDFKDKIAKVHQAFDDFKAQQMEATVSPLAQTSALPQVQAPSLAGAEAIAEAVALAEAQASALAEATALAEAEAASLAEAQALEELKAKIFSKKDEVTCDQAQLNFIKQELTALNTTHQQIEATRQAADQKIQGITDTHTTLTTLNSKLNTYFLKGTYLEDEDEPIVHELEKALYGENNSTGQLRVQENRTTQLDELLVKREDEIRLRELLVTDLSLRHNAIQEKEIAQGRMQNKLTSHQLELDDLIAQLPLSGEIVDLPLELNKSPLLEEAQKTFWGLGDQFWKQIIDGKAHQHGPMVFDQGLHRGHVEPGFFSSLKRGCEFASDHLCEPLSVSFYKDLHKTLCGHFKGRENDTLVTSADTGKFIKHTGQIKHNFKLDSDLAKEQFRIIEETEGIERMGTRFNMNHLTPDQKLECEKDIAALPGAVEWRKNWETDLKVRHEKLADEMTLRFQELGIAPYCKVRCLLPEHPIYIVDYRYCSAKEVEEIVDLLVDRYNRVIEETHSRYKNSNKVEDLSASRSEIITAIADLYQMLEWLHPFADGQGRTDLVLLNKLLTEQGLNPSILEDPYVSSWSGLTEWKDYLEKGMAKWQEARLNTVK